MIDFMTGCSRLFTMTFSASQDLDAFRFIAGALILGCCYGLFLLIYKGVQKK